MLESCLLGQRSEYPTASFLSGRGWSVRQNNVKTACEFDVVQLCHQQSGHILPNNGMENHIKKMVLCCPNNHVNTSASHSGIRCAKLDMSGTGQHLKPVLHRAWTLQAAFPCPGSFPTFSSPIAFITPAVLAVGSLLHRAGDRMADQFPHNIAVHLCQVFPHGHSKADLRLSESNESSA
jgi:hypothetical protein